MSTTITTAARQYATRPKDERYPSPQAMIADALHDRQQSAEREYNLKDLRAVAINEDVHLESGKGAATFTHWSFGQFSRMLGAPASYLRELPAPLAADCINHGIGQSPTGTRVNLLVKAPNGNPMPVIRAATSDSYARVWDSELYSGISRLIMDRDPQWTTPPTWDGTPAGAYRGDRDSFLILTNGGSIVTDPSLASTKNGGEMYRGILVRNSEVGASSIVIERILYEYVCGNHNLWGAVMDRQFRRRHTGRHVVHAVAREVADLARSWTQRSASQDEAILRYLIDHQIATTKDGMIDELRNLGLSKDDAATAYTTCEQRFVASPRSYWGAAQGITAMSQLSGYQDTRFSLDQVAADLLKLGARKHAVA